MKLENTLDVQRLSSIILMMMTAVIIYFISQYYIFDIARGFIISAISDYTFPAMANIVFILSMYVLLEGIGLVISSTVTYRDIASLKYAAIAALLTWIAFIMAGAVISFSVQYPVDELNWILLPIFVLVDLENNPAYFLVIVAIIFCGIDGTLNYFKRTEVMENAV